jgi:ABC-type nitrate/sulfonate/bicarbonate transport system substrate-binding protein
MSWEVNDQRSFVRMQVKACLDRFALLFLLTLFLLSYTTDTSFSAEGSVTRTRVGFFREEGLEVELIVMQAIQTIQATLGNSTQFASATGSAISSAIRGAEIKVVLAVTERPSFDLIVQPNITTVQQLRGKKIGTGGVGSLAEILARRILMAHGVRPEEVAILATGPSHVTYLSLKAKVIDAAPLQMPLTFTAQDEGFRKLVSAGDFYRAVQGGLATTKAILSEQPELVTKVVRAMLRAIRLIKSDRNYAINFLKGPWLDIGKDPEKVAARVYDAAAPDLLENGAVGEDLQREMIADASVRAKPAQPVLPEQVFDFRIVHKVSQTLR